MNAKLLMKKIIIILSVIGIIIIIGVIYYVVWQAPEREVNAPSQVSGNALENNRESETSLPAGAGGALGGSVITSPYTNTEFNYVLSFPSNLSCKHDNTSAAEDRTYCWVPSGSNRYNPFGIDLVIVGEGLDKTAETAVTVDEAITEQGWLNAWLGLGEILSISDQAVGGEVGKHMVTETHIPAIPGYETGKGAPIDSYGDTVIVKHQERIYIFSYGSKLAEKPGLDVFDEILKEFEWFD